jgi:hypothetical protein
MAAIGPDLDTMRIIEAVAYQAHKSADAAITLFVGSLVMSHDYLQRELMITVG